MNGLFLTRWTVAVVTILVGLLLLITSSISIMMLVWKATPLTREFGISALSVFITGSVIIAILGYMLFSLGARFFLYAGLVQKKIRELEAQEIVSKVFKI